MAGDPFVPSSYHPITTGASFRVKSSVALEPALVSMATLPTKSL
jgi:hypothetical protein